MNYDWLSVSDGNGDAVLMHVNGSGRLTGATTIPVDSVVNVPTKFIGTYGVLGSDGLITAASKRDFTGHVSGSDLEIDSFMPGSTDNGNDVGDVVIIKPNTSWSDSVATFIKNMVGLGTPESITVDQIVVDTSATLPASSITTSNIAVGAVTDTRWRNGIAFRARKTTTSTVSATTATKVTLPTEEWDIGSNYDTSTSRFTAPAEGVYHFNGEISLPNDTNRAFASIFVNGVEYRRGTNGNWSSTLNRVTVSGDILLEADDYVELYVWRGSAGDIGSDGSTEYSTAFSGHLVTRVDS